MSFRSLIKKWHKTWSLTFASVFANIFCVLMNEAYIPPKVFKIILAEQGVHIFKDEFAPLTCFSYPISFLPPFLLFSSAMFLLVPLCFVLWQFFLYLCFIRYPLFSTMFELG
ncbi:hypothetical protein XELAEV_18012192mg [Xenopus laevis]|uniref:Uncharacterized protein n=1 Tax=Xenopus laevis TaxID=8355 RepID=A0A974HY17_XENLA|nr:hypothetical protein XELAEV_18012192mg [Xenopus laevis]